MKSREGRLTSQWINLFLLTSACIDLASKKSSHSPNWRVQNQFGEYEIKVTRQVGEYEIFLMSNPDMAGLINTGTILPVHIYIYRICNIIQLYESHIPPASG